MPIPLSHGENIIREYKYAKEKSGLTTTEETLLITNKRIIRQTESLGAGTEGTFNAEMPIEDAKYVTTSYEINRRSLFMSLCIMFAIFGLLCIVASIINIISASSKAYVDDIISVIGISLLIFGIICILLSILFLILYIKKKDHLFSYTICTDTRMYPAFSFGNDSYVRMTDSIDVNNGDLKINREVAKEMSEDLGMVIIDINKDARASKEFKTRPAV